MKFSFKEVFDTIGQFTNEHKPELATGAGLILMFGGTAAAVYATVKSITAIADRKEDKLALIAPDDETYDDLTAEEAQEYDAILDNPLPLKETVEVCWKWWILPAGLLAAGTGCILYSDHEQAKRIGSLMAKASVLAFKAAEAKDYKEAAKELLGEDKEKEIQDRATIRNAQRRGNSLDNLPVYGDNPMKQRYQEYYSGQKFWADPQYIDDCINELNMAIVMANKNEEYTIKLYTWFDILGLRNTPGCGEELEIITNDIIHLGLYGDSSYVDSDGAATIILKFPSGTLTYKEYC